ncbi:MAG: hypothetical protein P4N24_07560 [Acidobacteriota bacterium]|nr:hypothetical protein [Acidobacteriota bacterium]
MKKFGVAVFQVLAALSLVALVLYLIQIGIDARWVLIGSFTAFFFGYVCYHTQDFWHNPKYWAVLSGGFGLHVIGVILIERNWPTFPLVHYGAIGTAEALGLFAIIVIGLEH